MEFFNQNPEIVARDLLGKIIVRKFNGKFNGNELRAKIVETEAYFDEKDPASRARKNGDLRNTMLMQAGTILIYGVHNSWLINIVTEEKGKASAVLIRAIEPLNFNERCNGPGLLTKALKIDKSFHKQNILNNKEIWIENFDKNNKIEIVESFRIGVKKDLPKKLRFYIKNNKFISRK